MPTMAIDLDGKRDRLWSERNKAEAQQGYPLRDEITKETRGRLIREILALACSRVKRVPFHSEIAEKLNRRFGKTGAGHPFRSDNFELEAVDYATHDRFLDMLEICADTIWENREDRSDLDLLQSLLADDLSAFRLTLVPNSEGQGERVHVIHLDNKHLHRDIVDRTFELTRVAELASAQGDYADAWKHYSKGNLDNALTDAHKAVESACKAVVKKINPASTPDHMQFGLLIGLLVQHDVIPQQLNHVCGQLEQIFRGAGSLRNQAGAAHGSLNPTSPEASVALLGLRLSGTLIAFLGERWLQMK
jgi:Abortive infection C-terminus